MDREATLKADPELLGLFQAYKALYQKLGSSFIEGLNRLPSLPDLFVDRWERARMLGFGEGSNIYDNSLVIGDVTVGRECWIGPNTVLDGSGGLVIGDFCTVSAGVQIYTHDNVKQTLTSKGAPIEREKTNIGNNVYIAPNVVIAKGVTIGSHCVIATGAFVNKSFPPNTIVMGLPAKSVGTVNVEGEEVNFLYTK